MLYKNIFYGLLGLILGLVAGSSTLNLIQKPSEDKQLGLAYYSSTQTMLPFVDSSYDIGTTTKAYRDLFVDQICLTADSCKTAWPTGGSGSSPFTSNTSWGALTQSTTSLLAFPQALISSTTIGRATFGTLTATSSVTITPLTSALIVTDSAGLLAEYGGAAACTNQAVTAISAVGGTTCTTLTSSYVDSSIAVSARNLTVAGTANQITSSAGAQDLSADRTWTLSFPSLVVFPSNATSTLFSTTYASSTQYFGAGLADCNTENMLTWTSGRFGCESDTSGAGGGAYPFTPTTVWGALAQSTSSLLAFPQGLISSSTMGQLTVGVVFATSTTATSTFAGATSFTKTGDTIALLVGTSTEYAVNGLSYKVGIIDTSAALGDSTPMLFIKSNDTSGGNADIRIDSPDADIEFKEIDLTAPEGVYEIEANSSTLQFNSRNSNNNGFEHIMTMNRYAEGGQVGIGTGFDTEFLSSLFTLVSTSSLSHIFDISSISDSDGDLLTFTTTGRLGIGTTSPYAKLSVVGEVVASHFTATSSLTSTFAVAPTFSSLTSALILTGSTGLTAEYTGIDCTNQFVRDVSALGAGTCATITSADVDLADLTATNSTLTFSGTYDGQTARTIGLNLASANTWTANQFFSYATSTLFAFASSTGGNLTVGSFFATSTLEIPDGVAPVASTTGAIGWDSTDQQFIIATSTTGNPRVLPTMMKLWGATVASTSPDLISGGRIWLPPQRDGFDVVEIHCAVDGGTSVVIAVSNSAGSTDSETVTCDADGATDTSIDTNSRYAAGSLNSLEIGTVTGTVDYLTFSIWGIYTRE